MDYSTAAGILVAYCVFGALFWIALYANKENAKSTLITIYPFWIIACLSLAIVVFYRRFKADRKELFLRE